MNSKAVMLAAASAALAWLAPAAESVNIGKNDTTEWKGKGVPEMVDFQPLVGAARKALRFKAGAEPEMSAGLNLDGMETITVRLSASLAGQIAVRFNSGEGYYRITAPVLPCEQVLLLPVGGFSREENATGWEKIDGVSLIVPGKPADLTLDLLGLTALPPGAAIPGDDLFLLKPFIPRVNPVGVAWPVYAVLTETIYPDRSPQVPAALQNYLKEMWGAEITLNPKGVEVKKGMANVILLGREVALKAGTTSEQELDRQGYCGFVIRADNGAVTIAGQTRHGTGYGVYRYLEQHGFKYYAYGCVKAPRQAAKVMQVCDLDDRPYFDGIRLLGGGYDPGRDLSGVPARAETREEFVRLFGEDLLWGWTEHTAAYLVPKNLYYDQHPDYYALRGDGKRIPKETGDFGMVICTTHPDVLRISAERALRWIDLQPDRKFFNISQGDNYEWCRCERCKAMEYEPGNYSDMMLYWVNHVAREVAKKYPDKILITYGYGPTQRPPVKLKPESNVHLYYAAWPNKTSAPCAIRDFDAPDNVIARNEILGWLKVAPGRVGLYDYPAPPLNGMAWRVKWCARHKMSGFMHCGLSKWFDPLTRYVMGQLEWDPFREVAELKREFVYAYYGEAAPVMEKVINGIYDRLEHGDYDSRVSWGVPPVDYFQPAFVKETLALFDQAAGLLAKEAVTDPKSGKVTKSGRLEDVENSRRIFVGNCLARTAPGGRDYTEQEMESFSLCLKRWWPEWMTKHDEAVAKAKADGKKAPGFDGLADTIWDWTRVRVAASEKEGEVPPMVQQLMDDPAGTIKKNRVTEFVEKIEDGWRVPAAAFTGGAFWRNYNWRCEGKDAAAVRGTMTELSRMKAKLVLKDAPPDKDGILDIDGQDSDKFWCPHAPIQVFVNGRKLFDATNPCVKCGWTRFQVPLPKGTLRQGENIIEVRNLFNSDSLTSHWFMLSEVLVKFPEK